MTVLYDHQAFTGARYGGVARYFYDLIVSLRQQHTDAKLSILLSNNEYLRHSDWFRVQSFPYLFGFMPTSMLVSQINRQWSSVQLMRGQFDVFHPTFFHDYFLKFVGRKPFVLTYHDVIKEKFGDQFGHLDNGSKDQKQRLLDRSAAVIAVSENTKRDLLDVFRIRPEKITVVHHATAFGRLSVPDTFQVATPDAYLLYVGTRNDYKNFGPFLSAVAQVLRQYPAVQLVCAGGGPFTESETQLIERLGLTGRVRPYPIDDWVLYRLYQRALAFVYPSLYEGFGLPILEAFAVGCPVVLSRASSFPEVAQDAALYFDPRSEASMRQALEAIVQNADLRESLRRRGNERQRAFAPEQVARQTLAVYERVV